MLVNVSDTDTNITDVHTFNDTAAFIWNAAQEHGLDAEALAHELCGEYDVDFPTALADVRRLLDNWRSNGLVLDD